MKIIKFLQDRLWGEPAELTVTGTRVRICQGRKAPEYELPKTFQEFNFLNHAEEMAGWLQAVLQEEKIKIRRLRIILDSGQVYLQAVKLPEMTVEEQQNWVRWEGSQYIPFKPGTYQAVLVLWTDPADFRAFQENRLDAALDVSAKRQATEEVKLQSFLLAAIPMETVEALKKLAAFLNARLEELTAAGPHQAVLPVNLLPSVPRKEIILKRCYQSATALCLLISVFLTVRGVVSWQRAQNTLQETERQLAPFHSVKGDYEESKKTDFQIGQYQQKLQYIGRTEPVWAASLKTIGKTIPEGCWLEGLHQKQAKSGQLEIKGYALNLEHITEFLEKLKRSEAFSEVRLVESGAGEIKLNDRGGNKRKVISFLLLAELAPVREEGMP